MSGKKKLEEVAPNIYSARGSLKLPKGLAHFGLGFDAGKRMTIIKLNDQSLFIHSPAFDITPSLKEEIAQLGKVKYIVTPNIDHYFFIAQYQKEYPDALVYSLKGLQQKCPDIKFVGDLDENSKPSWASEIDFLEVKGAPVFNEVAFFHKSSKSLLVGDLAFTIDDHSGLALKLLANKTKSLNGFTFIPRGGAVVDRDAMKESVQKIIDTFDFQRVLSCHGGIIGGADVKERFQKTFDKWIASVKLGKA